MTARETWIARPALVVGLIAVVAGTLRLYYPQFRALSGDEIYSAVIAQQSIANIYGSLIQDSHPPIYFVLLHIWQSWLGNTEIVVRSFSAIASTLCVVIAYFIGKNISSQHNDHRTGYVAAMLMAINPYQVEIAHTARMYALYELAALISILGLIKVLFTSRPSARWILIWSLSNLVALFTHYYACYLVGVEAFIVLVAVWRNWSPLRTRQAIKATALTIGVPCLIFSPWVMLLFYQQAIHHVIWNSTPQAHVLWATILGGYAIAFIALALTTKQIWLNRRHPNSRLNSIVLLIISSFVIPYVVSTYIYPSLQPRHLAMVGGLAIILIAVISSQLTLGPKYLIITSLACLSVLNLPATFFRPNPTDWQQAARFLDTHTDNSDLIVFHQGYNLAFGYNYYQHGAAKTIGFPASSKTRAVHVEPHMTTELSNHLGNQPHQVFVVLELPRDPKDLINQTINQSGYQRSKIHKLGTITVFEYRKMAISPPE